MPTLAELKNKAAKVKDASISSLSNTKDRLSSQPSKNINWNAEIKSKPPPPPKPAFKPPPPPSRTSSVTSNVSSNVSSTSSKPPVPPVPLRKAFGSATPSLARSVSSVSQASSVSPSPPPRPPPRSINSHAAPSASPSPPPSVSSGLPPGPPPPIRRETRPDQPHPQPPSAPQPPPSRNLAPPPPIRRVQQDEADIDRIDWANLSPEDKQEFFSWLDEFFGRYLGVPVPPRSATDTVKTVRGPPGGQAPTPKLPMAPRPPAPPRSTFSGFPASTGPLTSYPPPSEHDSHAEDLAHYFLPSTHWSEAWYASENGFLAPPLRGNGKLTWTGSASWDGRTKTIFAGVLFSDLSMCWYTVSFPQHASPTHDPNDPHTVSRSARFLPRPAPWPRAPLVDAHETYGETIAGFAESFEGTGQPCARGECWDLANEALKSLAQYDWVPQPVPSISRTHGHLLYEGRAEHKGATQAGRWRGGDDRVRRGDIVEWRTARVGAGPRAWALLGDPEHTAVIVGEMVPRVAVEDGMSVPPRDLGTLEVIEQSLGKPPKRATYDLSQMEEGEIWIYRPVGMEAYVGSLLVAQCPDNVRALSL
ncbi:hypothetical protein C8Q77DRAFT_1119858 [Trametes polyzona]|nr:hypothetical protein C8Q77DRAFT_1119858 [Trametes polyzona]